MFLQLITSILQGIGTLLVFFNSPLKQSVLSIRREEENKRLLVDDKRQRKIARIGLALIISGTFIQIIQSIIIITNY